MAGDENAWVDVMKFRHGQVGWSVDYWSESRCEEDLR